MKTGFSAQSKRQYRRDFKILTLDDGTKKLILKNVIKANRKDAAKNIRGQKAPQGGKWTARKTPKIDTYTTKKGRVQVKHLPMLRKIMRNTRNTATPQTGKLQYKNPVSARIAAEHQDGALLPIRRGERENEQQGTMATPAQAELLLRLGFNEPKHPAERERGKEIKRQDVMQIWAKRIAQGDKSRRKPSSVNYITSHLTFGQAGALIALLKKEQGISGRNSDKMVLPSRPFIDESQEQADKLFTEEFDKTVTSKLK